jgi:hypothetical protein
MSTAIHILSNSLFTIIKSFDSIMWCNDSTTKYYSQTNVFSPLPFCLIPLYFPMFAVLYVPSNMSFKFNFYPLILHKLWSTSYDAHISFVASSPLYPKQSNYCVISLLLVTKILHGFLISLVRATRPACVKLLNLINILILYLLL